MDTVNSVLTSSLFFFFLSIRRRSPQINHPSLILSLPDSSPWKSAVPLGADLSFGVWSGSPLRKQRQRRGEGQRNVGGGLQEGGEGGRGGSENIPVFTVSLFILGLIHMSLWCHLVHTCTLVCRGVCVFPSQWIYTLQKKHTHKNH